jgi:hypothetical protein
MLLLNIPKPDMIIDSGNLSKIPKNLRGVYLLFNENSLLYIGKTNDLKTRLGTHIRRNPIYKKECNRIEIYIIESQIDMDIYETYLINVMKPLYNKDKVFIDKFPSDSNQDLYVNSNLYTDFQSDRYKDVSIELNNANERLLQKIKRMRIDYKLELESIMKTTPAEAFIKNQETIKNLRKSIKSLSQHIKELEEQNHRLFRLKEVKPDKLNDKLSLESKRQESLIIKQSVDNDLLEFEIDDLKKENESQTQKTIKLQLLVNEVQEQSAKANAATQKSVYDLQQAEKEIQALKSEMLKIKSHWLYRWVERLTSQPVLNKKQKKKLNESHFIEVQKYYI